MRGIGNGEWCSLFWKARPPKSPCVCLSLPFCAGQVCQDDTGVSTGCRSLGRVAVAQQSVLCSSGDCGGHVSDLPFLEDVVSRSICEDKTMRYSMS